MIDEDGPIIQRVWAEQNQRHETRIQIIKDIEKKLDRPVVVFYTSFHFPVSIEDTDADMLESLLQKLDLSKGLALVINSPGGYGTAAERIINICKKYSGTGEYWAIVPNRAKSAATMICLGASKIYMSPTSELGPVDPIAVVPTEDGRLQRFSVFHLVQSYKELFEGAIKTNGHLEPYIQQLSHYDIREIKEYETALELAEDIAIKALQSCMIPNSNKEEIKQKIKMFLTPKEKKIHERAIYSNEAKSCGLIIEEIDVKDKLWEMLYELHIRTNNLVSNLASVSVESADYSFARAPPDPSNLDMENKQNGRK